MGRRAARKSAFLRRRSRAPMEQNMEENPSLAALIAQRAEFANQMSVRLGDACADAGGDSRQIASQLLDIILRSFEKQGLPAADAKIFDKSCVSRFGDEIGRASCRKECVSTCRFRWSASH